MSCGALPRTPGFSSGMGSHRSGWAARIDGCDLARNCGLWYCQTAGQNLQAMFNRHQWLKKNRPACSVAGPPNHAGLKRHSDASARVSLTGCVPAEPASVFPALSQNATVAAFSHHCLIKAQNCGMNEVGISPFERNDAQDSGSSFQSSHSSTAASCSERMQMACMIRF
jgi:hypothetical protein